MKHKLYFSYGMTKCGSTLAFKLTRALLEANGYPQDVLPEEILGQKRVVNFAPELTEEKLAEIVAHVDKTGAPLVLKSHTPPTEPVAEMLRRGEAIGHAIFRDPREMALSMLDHGARSRAEGLIAFEDLFTLEDTFDRIERQIGWFEEWLALPGINPWFYDDFAWDQAGAVERLKSQTGLACDTARLLSGFDDTKHMHFNRGVKGRWRMDMSAEDARRFEERFAGFYARMDNLRAYWRDSAPAQPRSFLGRMFGGGRG